MKWSFWLGWRFLKAPNKKWNSTAIMALVGIVIGVASLVVAMAVMSGFGRTLREAVVDSTGDMIVIQRGQTLAGWQSIGSEINRIVPGKMQAITPYLLLESVATHSGKVAGVAVQGMEEEGVSQVLGLKNRIVEGKISFEESGGVHSAAIGQGLAKTLELKAGDEFQVVFPRPHPYDPTKLDRKLLRLKVSGVLSLGKYDYDERLILTSIGAIQELIDNSEAFTGVIIKLKDSMQAPALAEELREELGMGYYIRDWKEINAYLFEAVDVERIIIFFVLLIIVIAAAVNVAITINVNVVQRYSDIAVLKAIGMTGAQIWRILSLQGLVIGFVGLTGGYALGAFLSFVVEWLQNGIIKLPQETYKIDRIYVDLRFQDGLAIVFATLIICFLSAALPALRGARLKPAEGIRYE